MLATSLLAARRPPKDHAALPAWGHHALQWHQASYMEPGNRVSDHAQQQLLLQRPVVSCCTHCEKAMMKMKPATHSRVA